MNFTEIPVVCGREDIGEVAFHYPGSCALRWRRLN
jgi:hypothetical protein